MTPELAKRIVSNRTFPLKEFWNRPLKPTQICLHHTASGPGVASDIQWWKNDNQPVSTPVLIDRDGTITQIYATEYYAFHLGLEHAQNRKVESLTIGIEIDAWGWLTQKNGKYYSYTGAEIPVKEVCILKNKWRGQQYFNKYTEKQLESLKLLLIHLGEKYDIPLYYKGQEMWNVSENARYAKVGGIYGHCSFRPDKTDVFPQPELIEMLKTLQP
jgi:N-acetyl-anhydromuramyl-L-alanine amidase AmpD